MPNEKGKETKLCKHCQTEIPKKAKVCPNCKRKQGGIVKWIVIAVVVLAIIGAAAGGSDDNSKQASNTNTTAQTSQNSNDSKPKESEPTEDSEPEITYTAYTVTQMMDDLDNNALKAESTYKDQYVEITGRLNVIDSSGKYISLYPEDDEWAFVGVQCNIKNEDQKAKVMEMSTGDIVTLKGKVKSVGEVLGYTLDIDEIE